MENTLRFLFGILFAVTLTTACPTNETLQQLCKCQSSYNGILLDCSGQNVSAVLRALKENQIQLGLIQELTIKNTTFATIEPRVFKGLYIKKLDLSENQIEIIEDKAFDGLENILQTLILNKNRLSEIPAKALNGLAALLQLDLSNNTIGNLEEHESFRNTPKLFDLNLGNNRICKIQKTVFDAVKHSVQTLNLGYNCFNKVPASAIRGFKQLLALHLHKNFIPQLEPLQFMNLPLLNLINLAENQIGRIHRQAFLNVPNLRLMYLSDNNVTQIQAHQFSHFETLEMLDLSRNKIETVPTLSFANMPRLTQLYLGFNKISNIQKEAFANSSIQALLLPSNKLTQLNPDMLDGLTFLQQFSVKDNQIESIVHNTFYHMPNLVMIDMSGNQLAVLPPATFLTQLNLFLVELSRNQLITTPYNAFNKRVGTVILQENPLVCTERVHLLRQGVGVYVPGTPDIICGGTGVEISEQSANTGIPAFVQGSTTQTTTVPKTDSSPSLTFFTPPSVIRPVGPPVPNPTQLPISVDNGPQVQIPDGILTPFLPVTDRPTQLKPSQPAVNASVLSNPQFPHVIPLPPSLTNPITSAPIDRFLPPTPRRSPVIPYTRLPPAPTGPPRTIRPFPVPFISNNPLNVGFRVTNPPATTPRETLPPGIITAGAAQTGLPIWTRPKPPTPPPWQAPAVPTRRPIRPWQDGVTGQLPPAMHFTTPKRPVVPAVPTPLPTTLPAEVKTIPPKKPDVFGNVDRAAVASDNNLGEETFKSATAASATTTIAVCLTVVIVVMVAVFVTLCVVRHKNNHRLSQSSSASRTSAYVAAQAARLSFGNYGTASLVRPSKTGSSNISPPLQSQGGNGQTWIYASGTYANPSSYYSR